MWLRRSVPRVAREMVVGVVLFGCAASQAPEPQVAADVITHQETNKPPLSALEREGDPSGALAIAAFAPGGVAAHQRVGAAVASRLRSLGLTASIRVAPDALLVGTRVPPELDPARVLGAVREGLMKAPLGPATSVPAIDDPCGAVVTVTSPEALRAALGWTNTAIGVVGDGAFVERFANAYRADAPWAAGNPPLDAWPEADGYSLRRGSSDGLLVGVRTAEVERALGAARTLGADDSTLHRLARATSPGFTLDAVRATVRPRGACLVAELTSSDPTSTASVARAARAVQFELRRSLESEPPLPLQRLAFEATDPVDAALRAAWSVLAARLEPGPERTQVIERSRRSDAKALEREVTATEPLKIALEARVERGQGRLWALLSSECPTAHEDSRSAGHTAAALLAAARSAAPASNVSLEPWFGEHGLGLIASAPVDGDRTPLLVAEALGRGLLAAVTDAPAIGAAREQLIIAHRPSPTWELGLRLASDGHPSELVPQGIHAALGSLNPSTAAHAVREFMRGRLKLAVLVNTEEGQALRLRDRLAELLVPLGPTLEHCPPSPEPSRTAGDFVVADAPGAPAVLLYPVPAEELPMARASARLLGSPGGWLSRAVVAPGIASHAEAVALGVPNLRAAVAIVLRAPEEQLAAAVMQTRALVERLAGTHVSEATLEAVRARLSERQWEVDPRHRLVQLLLSERTQLAPGDPSEQSLRRFLQQHLRDDRLIVVRPQVVPAATQP